MPAIKEAACLRSVSKHTVNLKSLSFYNYQHNSLKDEKRIQAEILQAILPVACVVKAEIVNASRPTYSRCLKNVIFIVMNNCSTQESHILMLFCDLNILFVTKQDALCYITSFLTQELIHLS